MRVLHLIAKNHIVSALLLLCGFFSSHAFALAPEVSINDYHHQTWSRKDGAPADISAIAQGDDGWMWIGTSYGLYRFDGLRFERYQSPRGKQLAGTRISYLVGAPGNEVVIGYVDGGVDIIRDGEIADLPSNKKLNIKTVWDIAPDFDGSVWIATLTGLFRYSDSKLHIIGEQWACPRKSPKSSPSINIASCG